MKNSILNDIEQGIKIHYVKFYYDNSTKRVPT